jgi:hypothetical protein
VKSSSCCSTIHELSVQPLGAVVGNVPLGGSLFRGGGCAVAKEDLYLAPQFSVRGFAPVIYVNYHTLLSSPTIAWN